MGFLNKIENTPSTWVKTTFNNLAVNEKNAIVDGPFGTQMKVHEFVYQGIPVVEMENIKGNFFKDEFRRFISIEKFQEIKRCEIKGADIIISKTGSLGYAAIVPDHIASGVITSRLAKIRINWSFYSKKLFTYYLLYLRTGRLWDDIAKGTTMKILNLKHLKAQVIPLPPLNEQHRIVAKIEELFSELDKGVESLKQAREQLKVYRQSLLKHAFEGKLTEQWRKENADKLETAEQLLERIKHEREARYQQQLKEWKAAIEQWEKDGMVGKRPSKPKKLPDVQIKDIDKSNTPDGWALVKALYISDFITKGATPEKNELFAGKGDVPFIKVYNLTTNGKLDFSVEPTFVSKTIHNIFLSRSKCKPGDILMNIVGPPLGKVSVVPDTYPEWNINQAIVRYRTNIVEGNYLSNYLLSNGVVRSMMKKSKATAGQFNLTLEICRDVVFPICSISEEKEINILLDDRFSVIDKLESDIEDNIARSESLRQSILKKAFSGQLVPQDPNDEPASVLLERIAREKAEAEATAKKGRGAKKSQNV